MLLEGIVGFAVIIAITVFVTKFVLRMTMMWLSAAGSIASILGRCCWL